MLKKRRHPAVYSVLSFTSMFDPIIVSSVIVVLHQHVIKAVSGKT